MSKCLPKDKSKKGTDGKGQQKDQGLGKLVGLVAPGPRVKQGHNLSHFVAYHAWNPSFQPQICGLPAMTLGSLLAIPGLSFSIYQGRKKEVELGDLFYF